MSSAPEERLVDRFLPVYDVTVERSILVRATPEATYAAIERADIASSPLARALTALRDAPNRLARLFGRGGPSAPEREIRTFGDIARSGMGWAVLAEEPGRELVVGLVGRFWRRDYGIVDIAPEEFAGYAERGQAKVAVSFRVRPAETGWTELFYEARTQATDEPARRSFRRYWRVIGPGAALLMGSALRAIKRETERGAR